MQITVFYDHVREACRQTGKELSEIAKVLHEHGITGVEMDDHDLSGEGEALVKRLQECGLPIHSVYFFFDWGNHPYDVSYRKKLRRLSEYGIHHVLAVPGFVSEHQDRERCRKRMCRALRRMCRYAGRLGIQVYMEDFDDTAAVFAKGKEVKWFLDRIPELSCAFDTGNFLYSGEDALEQLGFLQSRIGYVHCKDRSMIPKEGETAKENIRGEKMYSASVGSGVIPMRELVSAVLNSGYRGTFAIEHFGSRNQLEDMAASADFLSRCFQNNET